MAKWEKIICWGETFPSLRALARDSRCKVSKDGLRYRLQIGLSPEEAATNRLLSDFNHETDDTKFCWHCKQLKILSDFHPSPSFRKGVMTLCKRCNAKSHRRWLLKTNYPGFSLEQFELMFAKQEGCCACCHRDNLQLVVDHCHKTGKIRGLLCHYCNTALGLLNESIKRCQQLAEYINATKQT